MKRLLSLLVTLFIFAHGTYADAPVSLYGSPASMTHQNRIAKHAGLTFVSDPAEVERLIEAGELVPLEGNANYRVKKTVSFPYARPAMRLFIERLSEQYREGTGEQLVVTSLIRPQSRQPRNSHKLSVHPTGIAVDLRISRHGKSRQWLESVLLKLERQGLLDITRERWPPHYHVALFPEAYLDHVEELIGPDALASALAGEEEEPPAPEPVEKKVETPVESVALVEPADTEAPASTPASRSSTLLGVLILAAAGYGLKRLTP